MSFRGSNFLSHASGYQKCSNYVIHDDVIMSSMIHNAALLIDRISKLIATIRQQFTVYV